MGELEMAEKGKENQNGHEQKRDLIHNIIAHMEHLMDIFEIGIAVIVAFGFLASVYPLLRELPLLGSMSNGTTAYRHFLESALDLVIGIEFIKMPIKHTPAVSWKCSCSHFPDIWCWRAAMLWRTC